MAISTIGSQTKKYFKINAFPPPVSFGTGRPLSKMPGNKALKPDGAAKSNRLRFAICSFYNKFCRFRQW